MNKLNDILHEWFAHFSHKEALQLTHCNYEDNYYGDQVCQLSQTVDTDS